MAMIIRKRSILIVLLVLSLCAWILLPAYFDLGLNEKAEGQGFTVTGITPLRQNGSTEILLEGEGFTPRTHMTLNLEMGNQQAVFSTLPTWGILRAIAVKGDVAFLANTYRGVQAVSLRNPQSPVIIGSAKTRDAAWDLALRNDFAFVADRMGGLQVIDIQNPSRLRRVAELPLPGRCVDVVLKGDYAYLASTSHGLQVVDIKDPLHPFLISPAGPPESSYILMSLAIHGDTAYLATAKNGLLVADISRPEKPQIISSIPDISVHTLLLKGKRLYCGSHFKEMTILDLSRPRSPQVIRTRSFSYPINQIVVEGSRAFLSTITGGLQILDLTDEKNPLPMGGVSIDGAAMAIVPWGDFFLVASGRQGLQVVERDQIEPRRVQTVAASSGELVKKDNFLYLAGTRFEVFEIPSPGELRRIASLPFSEDVRHLEISGERALIFYKSFDLRKYGFAVLDLSDPTDPRPIYRMEEEKEIFHAAIAENLVFAACGENGIKIYSLKGAAPHLLSSLRFDESILKIVVQDHRLYCLSSGGIQIIDVTTPEAPRPVGKVRFPWHYTVFSINGDVVLKGKHLYVLDGRNGIIVLSLEQPEPRIEGFLNSPGDVKDILFTGEYAWLLDFQEGIHLVNAKDPAHMEILNTIPAGSGPRGFALDQQFLYVSTQGGLVILPKPIELKPERPASSRQIRLKIPPQAISGEYTLQVSQRGEHLIFPGALELD